MLNIYYLDNNKVDESFIDKFNKESIVDTELYEKLYGRNYRVDSIFENIRPMKSFNITYTIDGLDLSQYTDESGYIFLYASVLGKPLIISYINGILHKDFIGLNLFPEKIEDLEQIPLCEIRGVLVKDKFIAFDFVAEDFTLNNKLEELDFLSADLGFEIPLYWDDISDINSKEELLDIINSCNEDLSEQDLGYNIDGIIIENKKGELNNLLRVGFWQNEIKESEVMAIIYKEEREILRPYAVTDDDIEIPLFNPSRIIRSGYYAGSTIYYRESEKLGYIPCNKEGKLLIEAADIYRMLKEIKL